MEKMRMRWVALLALLVALAGTSEAKDQEQAEPRNAGLPRYFPYPPALRPQVEFWKKIFAAYSRYQVVIHDNEHLDKVYKVLDFRPFLDEEVRLDGTTVDQIKAEQTKREIEKIRVILLKLHARGGDGRNLSGEEKKIWDLYKDSKDPNKFQEAAAQGRLRSQSGLRERFAEGIQISRRYLPEMEEIFRREGVPVELTRLPLVESCFNIQAYSKAAAAGIWQFIPSTGRMYMRVDNTIDERRDPLTSTRAAARLLKSNYEMLGTWPLAITAYNHGPYGMVNAVKTLGTTSIDKIIRHYRGKSFGFASRNFYPEFLAALEVEKSHKEHFGPLKLESPLRYDEVHLEHYVPLKHVAHCAGTTEAHLLTLNPAFQEPIRNGKAYVPRGYRLRVPAGASSAFLQRYAALDASYKASQPKAVFVVHKVRSGQTLSQIARQYKTTTTTLARMNGLKQTKHIRAGQALRVPVRTRTRAEDQEIETQRTGVQLANDQNLNGQTGENQKISITIVGDQKPIVQITKGGQSQKQVAKTKKPTQVAKRQKPTKKKPTFVVHKVRRGQTLYQIAQKYNTTTAVLKRVNGVSDARRLQAGQVLRVPRI